MDSDRPGGNPDSQRLKGLDGAFLAFESPTTHLHIAGVLIFDPTGVPGGVGFRQIRDMVAARVSRVPPFRRRMGWRWRRRWQPDRGRRSNRWRWRRWRLSR